MKILALIVLVCVFDILIAQTTFQKTIGGSTDDYGYSLVPTADGGYIFSGRTLSYGVGGFDSYLVKTNANGDTTWVKTYGNTGYDEAQAVRQNTDHGYIFTGQTDNVDAFGDLNLVRTDSNGVVMWTKTFGGAGTQDFGYSVRQTTDGGFIAAGMTASSGAGGRDMYLVKTDANGTLTWAKAIGGTGDDEARGVQQTADGGYIMIGFTQSYGNGYQICLVKTNSLGVVSWSKVYGGGGDEIAYGIQQMANGGYIICGQTTSFGSGGNDALLIKTDSLGAVVWMKGYGGSADDYAISVRTTTDGGFVFCGRTTSFGSGGGDVYLVKTDSAGGVLWSKAFGGSALDQGNSIRQTSDGGYIICGYTLSYGAGTRDMYIIKTDSMGVTTGCNTASPATTGMQGNVLPSAGPTDLVYSATSTPVTASRRPGSITSLICGVFTSDTEPIVGKQSPGAESVEVYPNPASGTLHITSPENLINAELLFTDITGRIIHKQTIYNNISSVDISGWGKGIYLYNIVGTQNSGTSARGKIVIQ